MRRGEVLPFLLIYRGRGRSVVGLYPPNTTSRSQEGGGAVMGLVALPRRA